MRHLFKIMIAACMSMAAIAVPATAQQLPTPPPAAILVLNQDRLLSQTEFGLRIQQEVEEASSTLAAQNRSIEQRLVAEELSLTEQRPTMSPEDFRVLADEFDTRVVGIRTAQAAKARDLQAQSEAAQQRFFEETFPILLQIVDARGASVLLDSRTVLLSAGSVDITDAAIAAIDAGLGRGGDAPLIMLPGLESDTPPEQE